MSDTSHQSEEKTDFARIVRGDSFGELSDSSSRRALEHDEIQRKRINQREGRRLSRNSAQRSRRSLLRKDRRSRMSRQRDWSLRSRGTDKPAGRPLQFSSSVSTSSWLAMRVPVLHPDTSLAYCGTLRLISIGGIGDVNKNMYIYEYGDDIVIIDCGIGFADEDMPGVDFLIPDISYLLDKKSKIRGILHTHGHDDHIGALPYIWPQLQCPIYASKITCGFIKIKMVEHELPTDQIVEIDPDSFLHLGSFRFQFFRLSHSIPDTIGFVIDTPVGRVIHSADFKFDWTPVIGPPTDVQRIAQFGSAGVLLLLSDSLGAEKPGYTLSEQVIKSQFESVAEKTPGKIIVTTTSSNISRIQLALDVARKFGRKVAVSGRSMDQNIGVARNLGYLHFSDDDYVPIEDIDTYEDSELLLLVAGSQGQSDAALSRVAVDAHRYIRLRSGDSVIFSTDPIPGNENQTNRLIDQLISRGAEVYYSNIFSNIHVSGHAAQEELKLMLGLVKAKYLLPIGGTERSTKKYADLAISMGYSKEQILLAHNGDILEFSAVNQVVSPKVVGKIPTKDVMVDGLGIGDLSEVVMRDRQIMSSEGMLVVIVPVDRASGRIQSGAQIVSRGFVYMKESATFIHDIARLVDDILDETHALQIDWGVIKKTIEDRVAKYIYKELKRSPLVLPVVFEI